MKPDPTHPYKVAVYIPGCGPPVREFTGYRSAAAAEVWAEVLRQQTRDNGWNYTFEVMT